MMSFWGVDIVFCSSKHQIPIFFIHVLVAYPSLVNPKENKLDGPRRMRQPLPHQAGQGTSWSRVQGFPFRFLVADLTCS